MRQTKHKRSELLCQTRDEISEKVHNNPDVVLGMFGCCLTSTRLGRRGNVCAILFGVTLFFAFFSYTGGVFAQTVGIPSLNLKLTPTTDPAEVATTLEVLFLLTVLSLAPAILIMLTSFTRTVIVLSFLKQAIGTQQMPSNQIIVGLSLFLTFFIMSPVFQKVHKNALQPYMQKKIGYEEAFEKGIAPIKSFMLSQTREKDLSLFIFLSKEQRPRTHADISMPVLIPSFVISELKTAFEMGFFIFIPFLIVDMVVASVLLSMGMMMLPPVMISLPFKLLLFIMVDGWYLVIGSIAKSFIR